MVKNKKIFAVMILLVLVIGSQTASANVFTDLWDGFLSLLGFGSDEEITTNVTINDIDITTTNPLKIIGYKTLYYQKDFILENCTWSIDKDQKNITRCNNYTHTLTIRNNTKVPIYEYQLPTKIESDGVEYNLKNYNGFVCSGEKGTYLIQISNIDGGSSLTNKGFRDKICNKDGTVNTKILDGMNCYKIYNLDNNKQIKEMREVYCEI